MSRPRVDQVRERYPHFCRRCPRRRIAVKEREKGTNGMDTLWLPSVLRFSGPLVLWYFGLADKTTWEPSDRGTYAPSDRRSRQYRLRYSVPELTSVGQVGVIEAVFIVGPCGADERLLKTDSQLFKDPLSFSV